jgi:histidine ammonia-lyase
VRAVIPPLLQGDRWYATEINQALALLRSGSIVEAVESAVGTLD